jgi:hypothetical protein
VANLEVKLDYNLIDDSFLLILLTGEDGAQEDRGPNLDFLLAVVGAVQENHKNDQRTMKAIAKGCPCSNYCKEIIDDLFLSVVYNEEH